MSLLSMVEAKLPPGFRFHPRDDELICDYLAVKLIGDGNRSFCSHLMLVDIDLNKCEPWDLPVTACVAGKNWYFFSLRDRKYATGQRTNRATISGYWKATGKDRPVARKGVLVGMRKTLVFYQGRAPKGKKTDWVMHEYRMEGPGDNIMIHAKEDWVLCKVFRKKRGVSTKGNMEFSHDDEDDSASQSLPPLMDNNYIAFDQAPVQSEGYNVQVPCFSNYPTNSCQTSSQGLMTNLAAQQHLATTSSFTHLGSLPDLSCNGWNQFSCDKKVLKTVLDNLSKVEPADTTLAEESLRDYLPHNGNLASQWNPFNYEFS